MNTHTKNDERRMLADTLHRLFNGSQTGMAELASAGVFTAFLREEQGGFGGDGEDIAVVFHQLGRYGPALPLADHLAGVRLLAASDRDDLRDRALQGDIIVTLAHVERDMTSELDPARLELSPEGALTGEKCAVAGLDSATHAVVTTTTGACLVALDDALRQTGRRLDGLSGGTLTFSQTPARRIATTSGFATARAAAMLALCAEMLGLMERVLELTQGYLSTRRQFDRALASFQSIAFRLADMATEIEMARGSVGNLASDLHDDAEREATLAATKTHVGRVASFIAEEAIQLHGGIGMTAEYALAPLVKRLLAADARFGDHHLHLHRFTMLRRPAQSELETDHA